MTPLELYDCIKAKYPIHEVECVCHVESTCNRKGYCLDKQKLPVLDFDKIKDAYYNGKTIATPASVDAVCLGSHNKHFCFVEMKGWDNYINFLDKQKNSIEETTDDYNLSGKLQDSQNLCILLANDKDLFVHMPVVFLLVTDIDVKRHGAVALSDMLNKLGGNSSDIYSQCVSKSQETLDSDIHIEHQYVYCREFDNAISVL